MVYCKKLNVLALLDQFHRFSGGIGMRCILFTMGRVFGPVRLLSMPATPEIREWARGRTDRGARFVEALLHPRGDSATVRFNQGHFDVGGLTVRFKKTMTEKGLRRHLRRFLNHGRLPREIVC